jgi:hypothetical protein
LIGRRRAQSLFVVAEAVEGGCCMRRALAGRRDYRRGRNDDREVPVSAIPSLR